MESCIGISVRRDACALVLSRGDIAIAAELTRERSTHNRARIFYRFASWLHNSIAVWVEAYQLKEVGLVFVEIDYNGLFDRTANAEFKLRLAGAMEAAIYGLPLIGLDCKFKVGWIGYRAAKSVFTGDGNASNTKLILASAWRKSRGGEKFERERSILAIAQAASRCRPAMIEVSSPPRLDSSYSESFSGG